jgi:hypothetical protein
MWCAHLLALLVAMPDAGVGRSADLPLNLNLHRIVLPTGSDDRLVKVLFVGDSQMGQAPNRLVGQVQKWDVSIVGRLLSCESQNSAGVFFSSVSGAAYGASLISTRVELGQDHGDGNRGSHFHHSRRFSVDGSIEPDRSQLGILGLSNGSYTRPPDFNARKFARLAVYDRAGGFSRFSVSEYRGGVAGESNDFGMPTDPGPTLNGSGLIRVYGRPIRPAGQLGSFGSLPVGLVVRDSDGLDSNSSLHVLGALIHDSPEEDLFPERGLVFSGISQSGWSVYDHLNTLNADSIRSVVAMNEGVDLVIMMFGHNREDDLDDVTNPDALVHNLHALTERIRTIQADMGYGRPDMLLIAPWMRGEDVGSARLLIVAQQMREIAQAAGFGFINLYDFYARIPPHGILQTPRGTHQYTLDFYRSHPADAATASNIMQDIEWHFNPENWSDACRADLAEPFGDLNFFDLAAYLALFNAQGAAADLAEPAGMFNFFDLAAYLNAFNAGCP